MLCWKGLRRCLSLYEFRNDGETLVAVRSVRFGKAAKAKFCVEPRQGERAEYVYLYIDLEDSQGEAHHERRHGTFANLGGVGCRFGCIRNWRRR